jgi:hypothetical protein
MGKPSRRWGDIMGHGKIGYSVDIYIYYVIIIITIIIIILIIIIMTTMRQWEY